SLCLRRTCSVRCFFFFQAEDGIRDFHVTGVQTCALPICRAVQPTTVSADASCGSKRRIRASVRQSMAATSAPSCAIISAESRCRSEERRVGKECGYRGPPCHWIKKTVRAQGTRLSQFESW